MPGADRIRSLDAARGFALLGILAVNILTFAWPWAVMMSPRFLPEHLQDQPATRIGYILLDAVFVTKMMTLFAMLFGAGALMYARKFEAQPLTRGAGLWYTRLAWLGLFGLLHGVLLWYGDILLAYAVCGMGLVWWAQRWSLRLLIPVGIILVLLGAAASVGVSALMSGLGDDPDQFMQQQFDQEIEVYTGSYLGAVLFRAISLIFMWLMYYIPVGVPMLTGTMLLGMALVRLGILTAERPARVLATVAAAGIGSGLALNLAAKPVLTAAGLDAEMYFVGIAQPIAILQSTGYAALIALLVRTGTATPITGALANVGRMAFTNYILQTVICTTIFYGHGFGRFATMGFDGLAVIVVSIWVFNLALSAIWLRFYRLGPLEWLWRSLTYMKPQPIRLP